MRPTAILCSLDSEGPHDLFLFAGHVTSEQEASEAIEWHLAYFEECTKEMVVFRPCECGDCRPDLAEGWTYKQTGVSF